MVRLVALGLFVTLVQARAAANPAPVPDWLAVEAETLRHFQAIVRMDTSDPPGGERPVVDYLREVLVAEGIEVKVFAKDPNRPNLVARLKGNGTKRSLLLMAHTDTVNVDPKKWTHPPFSAARVDGQIYGRGTLDDKDNVAINLMTMLLLKCSGMPLDRDVIFLAEAGEEGSVQFGIEYMVENHFAEIDAEFCLAEGGVVRRTGGKVQYGGVQTTEKIPKRLRLVARGVAGHGSVPLRTNAVVRLARAVAAVTDWQTEMRLNETMRAFFQRLAEISPPEEAARFREVLAGDESGEAQEYFSVNVPSYNSMLRTSISPTMISAGYRVNVIPSEVEATLDVRTLPDEDLDGFMEQMVKVINDPAVEITRMPGHTRPGAPPSSIHTEAFEIIESAIRRHYGVITLPTMSMGATDMAYLRARGIQCFGIGPRIDSEDGPRGFGAHSDQERIVEEALHLFMRFNWDVVLDLAAPRP